MSLKICLIFTCIFTCLAFGLLISIAVIGLLSYALDTKKNIDCEKTSCIVESIGGECVVRYADDNTNSTWCPCDVDIEYGDETNITCYHETFKCPQMHNCESVLITTFATIGVMLGVVLGVLSFLSCCAILFAQICGKADDEW